MRGLIYGVWADNLGVEDMRIFITLVRLCGHEPRDDIQRTVRCHPLVTYFLLARQETEQASRTLLLAGRRFRLAHVVGDLVGRYKRGSFW